MSLLHRASSTESLTHLPRSRSPISRDGASDEETQVVRSERGLSYNPLSSPSPSLQAPTSTTTNKEHPRNNDIGAHEVPRSKRLAQVAAAVLYCLLAAGVVFGYAALKPVLIAEGVYRERCSLDEKEQEVRVCRGQELRLNLLFTLAAVTTNIAALPIGTILDRYGPRVTGTVGAFFLALGALFLASAGPRVDLYIPGYLFLALGGPFVFISSFQLSNAFPTRSGLILALLTGAFDTSSAVFLVYRLVYEWTSGRATLKVFFLGYLVVPVGVLLAQGLLMPGTSYKTAGELLATKVTAEEEADAAKARDDRDSASGGDHVRQDSEESNTPTITPTSNTTVSEITALLGTDKAASTTLAETRGRAPHASGVEGALHHLPARRQLLSPWFILLALFTMLQMLRINLFVATIRPQYEFLLGSYAAARKLNSFFDVALPLGGIVGIPFIGILLDSVDTLYVLVVLVIGGLIVGALGLVRQNEPAAYAGVVLFVLYRPLYYTAVSDYSAKVFGFRTFGKVYGLVICAAGLFNLLQTVLDGAMQGRFEGDPRVVNAALMVATALVGGGLIIWVWVQERKMVAERVGDDGAEDERQAFLG
ncbi:MAG: hypothetical protein M1828_005137 [Chrysothrix sp. TS-e1954]|nr:MAG: hypothetical protein M1828_005137 [Chrysothrix sp. TS-e1954]